MQRLHDPTRTQEALQAEIVVLVVTATVQYRHSDPRSKMVKETKIFAIVASKGRTLIGRLSRISLLA